MRTCRNKKKKILFVLLTFVIQHRRGEITKKEKSLSNSDQTAISPFDLIRTLFPDYRCETGGSARACWKESLFFAPFSKKNQSNLIWIVYLNTQRFFWSRSIESNLWSFPKPLIEFPIRLYNLSQDPSIRHSLSI